MTISATNAYFSVIKRLALPSFVMIATSSSDAFRLCSTLPLFQGCPAGSIQSSFEVTLSYEGVETDIYLYVEEPSGMRVSTFDKGASDNLRQRGCGSHRERRIQFMSHPLRQLRTVGSSNNKGTMGKMVLPSLVSSSSCSISEYALRPR